VKRLSLSDTCTKPERPAKDKHSSLLQKNVNYGRKSFITLSPGGKVLLKKLLVHRVLGLLDEVRVVAHVPEVQLTVKGIPVFLALLNKQKLVLSFCPWGQSYKLFKAVIYEF